MRFRINIVLSWGLLVGLSLMAAACSTATAQPIPSAVPTTAVPSTPTAIPTATDVPSRSLVVCLGEEPSTLYPYGGSSRAQWSVLEAIYDGPIDTVNFKPEPVILQKIPSVADGDALVTSVDVKAGDRVMDANGTVVDLTTGTTVRPSGCTGADCLVNFDGTNPIKMDQMVVNYTLKQGVLWSDGTPLTAADSQYSYELSKDPDTPVSQRMINRTAAYTVANDLTVQWTGIPGYLPDQMGDMFWMPLPQHLWKDTPAANLLTADISAHSPIGWGPYMIKEWVQGDHIELVKNPNYFRASEGLPKFDSLVYRFLGEASDNNIAALLTQECDVVDQTSLLDEQLETVLELEQDGKLKAYIGQGPEWEHLDFGIKPASYDDGYNPYGGDRVDYFSDARVRQAFTYCSNRQGIIDDLLFGKSSIPNGFVAPTSPYFQKDLAGLAYDPAAGEKLLDEVGWKDTDGDPKTPRSAVGVANVPDGTALSINYVTTKAALRQKTAEILAASLGECGIQVAVHYSEPGELYGQGPDGVLFGRKFDLAQFAWDSNGIRPVCSLYESSQIPTSTNNWMKVNVTGYTSSAFDSACQSLRAVPTGSDDQIRSQLKAVESIYLQDIPSIPLYYRLKIAISRPDLCGMNLDVSSRSDLSQLESFDYGTTCP